jgi:hypothetical protein
MDRYLSSKVRRGAIAALAMALAVGLFTACEQHRQGDRCNPDLVQSGGATPQYNEDECSSGLSCQVPPTCVIAVCCPSQPPYTDPSCACFANPGAACACSVAGLVDAGSDAATSGEPNDEGGADAGDATSPIDAPSDAATDSSAATG